jgi:hypothetical protein
MANFVCVGCKYRISSQLHSYNNQFGTPSEGVSLSSIHGDDDDHAHAPKRPKLLASYWKKPSTATNIPSSSLHQFNKYLAVEWTDSDEQDCHSGCKTVPYCTG